jgi:putative transcriptional regulator
MLKITPKIARLNAGLTQIEIAKMLGVCRDTYATLELSPKKFTIEQAERFATAVALPLDEIFFNKEVYLK